jgi:hypothetical protein
VIIFIGVASSVLILPPDRIVRADGSLVTLEKHSSVRTELVEMARLFKDWRVAALMPMFFASNYFYAYQGAVNAGMFDGPTRALNATLEGAGAIVGALLIGFFILDAPTSRFKYGRESTCYFSGVDGMAQLTFANQVVRAAMSDWLLLLP